MAIFKTLKSRLILETENILSTKLMRSDKREKDENLDKNKEHFPTKRGGNNETGKCARTSPPFRCEISAARLSAPAHSWNMHATHRVQVIKIITGPTNP